MTLMAAIISPSRESCETTLYRYIFFFKLDTVKTMSDVSAIYTMLINIIRRFGYLDCNSCFFDFYFSIVSLVLPLSFTVVLSQ